jgi:hypothetical protein
VTTSESCESEHLHPWPVIASVLFEYVPQAKIPIIVDAAGLVVDWEVPIGQAYSAAMARLWRPRVHDAIRRLPEADQLVASQIVAARIAECGHTERLSESLAAIGWKLEDSRLVAASIAVHERFFPRGAIYDAYLEIRTFIVEADTSVFIIDPYVDDTILTLLGSAAKPGLDIRILTENFPTDFAHQVSLFQAQVGQGRTITIRRARDFHDRFVIIDESRCLHVGHSIKDIGRKACLVSEIHAAANRQAIIAEANRSWAAGVSVA